MLEKYLYVFFVSMVPVIELRGAIPIGFARVGMPFPPKWWRLWATCCRCP